MSATAASHRQDVRFPSGGQQCGAWLYAAAPADGPAPCIVMAHGFGSLKEGRLDAYAERFQAAGFAALVFDYRHFGASDGEPRQLLDIKRQHDDYAAAIAYARTLEGVDPERIVVWGSSFSGGHAIEVAARDSRLAAAISQVPHTSGSATVAASSVAENLRAVLAGLRDLAGSRLGRPPHYAPIVGAPGTLAAMTSPDSEPGYSALYSEGFEWRNEVAARAFLAVGRYSPGRAAARVRCPLLVQVGDRDVVTPPEPAARAAASAPKGELLRYPIGHFDVYLGQPFERAVADQIVFLKRALLPSVPT